MKWTIGEQEFVYRNDSQYVLAAGTVALDLRPHGLCRLLIDGLFLVRCFILRSDEDTFGPREKRFRWAAEVPR